MQKRILICGSGGMIGTHLTNRLKQQGHMVVGVDIKHNEFVGSTADFFILQDLTNQLATYHIFKNYQFDEVYNLAAVMGGMELLSDGQYDYDVLNQSTLINWNVIESAIQTGVSKIFFSSSACAYNMNRQEESANPGLKETDAYPVLCDLEYGYQKLITERMYMAAERCNDIQVRIGRFHNIYGPYGEWEGTKAKAPAALCRKVAEAIDGTQIEVFGDGLQTRSFTYIEDCLDGIEKLMNSEYNQPINIGSSEMVTINDLANMIIVVSGKDLDIVNINGPQGVRGRNSDNTLILEKLGWKPTTPLMTGIEYLYNWVSKQITNI